jgi:hypothetical protein
MGAERSLRAALSLEPRPRREIVIPSTLTPGQLRTFRAALFAVHTAIFEGVAEPYFSAQVVSPGAESTEIEVFRDEADRMSGYCAVHLYLKVIEGIPHAVLRVQAGLLPALRRGHSTIAFLIARTIRYKVRYPRHRMYLLLSPVHPSSYRLLAEYLPVVYPNRRYGTPIAMQAIMMRLADIMGAGSPVEGLPLVRDVGWRTRESAAETRLWTTDTRPDVQFFIAANPEYRRGHGLLTLAPLTFANIGGAVFRYAIGKVRRWIGQLGGGGRAAHDSAFYP